VSAINPLVAFYEIDGKKREMLFFYIVPDTHHTRLVVNIILPYGVKIFFLVFIIKKEWKMEERGSIVLFCPGHHTR
jgi:hypothetical protein